jgi:nitroreductase
MRYSCRAFLDSPINLSVINEVLTYASYAASSKNIQPWKVYVVSGSALKSLSQALIEALRSDATKSSPRERNERLSSPYLDRARQCGFSLFQHKGIERDDYLARQRHYEENFRFFGAPVELFISMDKSLPERHLIDLGIFLERVMYKAASLGLATCAQASVSDYPGILKNFLNHNDSDEVLFGVAMGVEDKSSHINSFRTEKLPVDDFTKWIF